jgi:ribose-phosphate pyrophosphokinase
MSPAPVILHAFADEAQPAHALAGALGIDCKLVDVHAFPDGEVLPIAPDTAPTTIVYRSLARPNDKLVPLLLACDAWRRAGAQRLILVAPYLCYLRQDAVFSPGQPNSQQVIGDLLGDRFDHIITVDAHLHRTPSIAAVFPQTTATDLSAAPAIAAWLTQTLPGADFVVGPDVESEPWVRQVAAALNADYRLFTKKRLGDDEVRLSLEDASAFSGRTVALVDDICSSGGTLIKAAQMLKAAGAREIVACITHALFDSTVEQRLRAAGVSAIASRDTVPHATNVISLAALLADALRAELPR